MGDLEMTKLCAKAMGLDWRVVGPVDHEPSLAGGWDPLHDDAQAMALIKQLKLHPIYDEEFENWDCFGPGVGSCNADLNRAIVECVAQMQAAKAAA